MKLYTAQPSGNSDKVKRLLSLIDVPYEQIVLDLTKEEHRKPAFLKVNPRGEVPMIEDNGAIVWDSAACLVYVARKFGEDKWLPGDPVGMAHVQQWLALAGTEIQIGLQYTRRGLKKGRWTAGNLEQGQAIGRVALTALDNRLMEHEWLASHGPTIADIACFPYVDLAPEANIPLDPYPSIINWIARCKRLPRWTLPA